MAFKLFLLLLFLLSGEEASGQESSDNSTGYMIQGNTEEGAGAELSDFEQRVLDRLRSEELDDIYLLNFHVRSLRGHFGTTLLCVKNGKARLIVLEDGDSRRERWISPDELRNFQAQIMEMGADSLPGLINGGLNSHPTFWTYLHLQPDRGYRVLADDPTWAGDAGKPYLDLIAQFNELESRPAPRVHKVAEGVPGGRTVYQSTDEEIARHLIEYRGETILGTLQYQKRADGGPAYGKPRIVSWYRLEEHGPVKIEEGPDWLDDTREDLPDKWKGTGRQIGVNWLSRQPDGWKVRDLPIGVARSKDGEVETLIEGDESSFGDPIVSSDGKWALIPNRLGAHWAEPNGLLLLDLQSRAVATVALEPHDQLAPVTYLPYHKAFLVQRGDTHYLLNPETGEPRRVTGEFRPWLSYALRPFQETGEPYVVWACVSEILKDPTTIGKYDLRTFTFEPVYQLEVDFYHHEFVITETDLLLKVKGDVVALPLDELTPAKK